MKAKLKQLCNNNKKTAVHIGLSELCRAAVHVDMTLTSCYFRTLLGQTKIGVSLSKAQNASLFFLTEITKGDHKAFKNFLLSQNIKC